MIVFTVVSAGIFYRISCNVSTNVESQAYSMNSIIFFNEIYFQETTQILSYMFLCFENVTSEAQGNKL